MGHRRTPEPTTQLSPPLMTAARSDAVPVQACAICSFDQIVGRGPGHVAEAADRDDSPLPVRQTREHECDRRILVVSVVDHQRTSVHAVQRHEVTTK
ncbi:MULTISPECIES: hypothetical protein [unclassified Rhodococcus (in: high G+C Gram-positive bacteria)]|uniref:hypothetical protein n=1 Tax=unclassified Rhodococcus (in: high G+C Gram-positive bacteria) TaxID=192944 RepID=UPI00092656FA|nr:MULTISPECIES: hypothetical protein [unclassified Rhodococcus (in: high G+C Gram-positive bacteria)]NCL76949.1 hypothetical protein [Rhodococcus sp. YH1]OLL18843.1 hypothetical protein BKE56_001805 [Rhodococcus sp. M8]